MTNVGDIGYGRNLQGYNVFRLKGGGTGSNKVFGQKYLEIAPFHEFVNGFWRHVVRRGISLHTFARSDTRSDTRSDMVVGGRITMNERQIVPHDLAHFHKSNRIFGFLNRP